MLKLITPPKGVRLPKEDEEVPPDEGDELFDCEGDEMEMEIENEVEEYAEDHDVESGTIVPRIKLEKSLLLSTKKTKELLPLHSQCG